MGILFASVGRPLSFVSSFCSTLVTSAFVDNFPSSFCEVFSTIADWPTVFSSKCLSSVNCLLFRYHFPLDFSICCSTIISPFLFSSVTVTFTTSPFVTSSCVDNRPSLFPKRLSNHCHLTCRFIAPVASRSSSTFRYFVSLFLLASTLGFR